MSNLSGDKPLLLVEGLQVSLPTERGWAAALRGVSWRMERGSVVVVAVARQPRATGSAEPEYGARGQKKRGLAGLRLTSSPSPPLKPAARNVRAMR